MSSSFPEFADCTTCGKEIPKVEAQVFSVPTCPESECGSGESGQACASNKGKFHDRLTDNFILPLSGSEGRLDVCEPELWSSCQWIALCYLNNSGEKIAILRITGCDKARKQLKVLNACGDGGVIEDNPPPGTIFKERTVIYPVPPPWCSAEFCQKLNNLLASQSCACAGVKKCLEGSTEICFSSVPTLNEDASEEAFLFGGIKPPGENNPSLWKSCLRKLHKLFTGFGGRTFCFADIPETTDAPDIIEGNPVAKRLVYLDGRNCLRKGATVSGGNCETTLNITATDKVIVGSDPDDSNGDDKIFAADALKVCLGGAGRLLVPETTGQVLVSCKDASNNLFWRAYNGGGMWHPFLSNSVMVGGSGTYGFAAADGSQVLPKRICNRDIYCYVNIIAFAQPSSNNQVSASLTLNGFFVSYMLQGGLGHQAMNPGLFRANQANLLQIPVVFSISGSGSFTFSVQIIGFFV